MSRLVSIAALIVLGGLALLGAFASWSRSGWFALGSAGVAAIALSIRDRHARRGLALVAGGLFAVLLGVRWVGSESGMVRMLTLPQGMPSRWLARLIDEQDVALIGTRALAFRWPLSPDERTGLLAAMQVAYADMRRDDQVTPSPVVDTLLGRQSPDAFDTLVIEPRLEPHPAPKYGVLFLHGYAGSHTMECWLVAKAAQNVGAVTVCPATTFSGYWKGEGSERIVRTSLDYLHARGITHVFLAGLSNGAVGVSTLARTFAPSLAGLVLISGAPADGNNAGLPTLVIHGTLDAVASPSAAQTFAARCHARYASFPGGHFVLLTRREQARRTLALWLMEQLGLHESGTVRR